VSGPDVAGIWAALARLADRTPEQRRADRFAAATVRTTAAMAAGRRYRTRDLRASSPRPVPARDPATGRFIRSVRQ
jgi:hypothetical protein